MERTKKTVLTLILAVVCLSLSPLSHAGYIQDRGNHTVQSAITWTQDQTFNGNVDILGTLTNTAVGNEWYVYSGTRAGIREGNVVANNQGKSWRRPFATIEFAYSSGSVKANSGDIIHVLPGHIEYVSADSSIDFDVAGVTVIGWGSGRDIPEIAYTGSAARVPVDAASTRLINLFFNLQSSASADSLTAAIDVSAADFYMSDCRFEWGSTAQPDHIIVLDGAADRAKIVNNVFAGDTSTGTSDAIYFTPTSGGSTDSVEITDNVIYGDFSSAAIADDGTMTITNTLITHNAVTNYNSGSHAVEFTSSLNTAASIYDNAVSTNYPIAVIDPGASPIRLNGNMWEKYGATSEGYKQGFELFRTGQKRTVQLTAAALPQTATHTLFEVVSGPIKLLDLTGFITTAIQNQACSAAISFSPTYAGQTTINALATASTLTAYSVGGTIRLNPSSSTALAMSGMTGFNRVDYDGSEIILGPGVLQLYTTASNTGNVTWVLGYEAIIPEAVAYTTGA